ncbi:hypothetical protein CRM22_009629 [Opisthorchis felineus]|uniref:Saposin B-type domain-containing protein n=1 Tax=Opisthorchis felineus TaxID=147828 RepID=A0A4S2L850_OPIFE|nr:hypothetical protein CRM22_009629 [Opisthorchis felineus]
MIRTWFILTTLLLVTKSSEVQTGNTGLRNVLCTVCETILHLVKTDENAKKELTQWVENACNKFKIISLLCPSISRRFISEAMKMLQANEPKDICKLSVKLTGCR